MKTAKLAELEILAKAIDTETLQNLSHSEADLQSQIYIRFKKNIIAASSAFPQKRIIYILGQDPNGNVFTYINSENKKSNRYLSPGQLYPNVSSRLQTAFINRNSFVERKTRADNSQWISALQPIIDTHTGNIIALLGMDTDAAQWNKSLKVAYTIPTMSTLALLFTILLRLKILKRIQTHTSSAIKYTRITEMATAAIIGITITLSGVWIAHEKETASNNNSFSLLASSKIEQLCETFSDIIKLEFAGLANFINYSQYVSQEEFDGFTRHLNQHSTVFSWQWVEPVKHTDIEQKQAKLSAMLDSDVKFWHKKNHKQNIHTTNDTIHYPVTRVSHANENFTILGYDLLYEPEILNAIEQATKTKLPVATKQITTLPNYKGLKITSVCWPVYSQETPAKIRGILFALLQFDELILKIADNSGQNSIDIELIDIADKPVVLASTFPKNKKTLHSKIQDVTGITFAFGKTLAFTLRPQKSNSTLGDNTFCSIVAIAGLIVTFAVSTILGLTVQRREEMRQLIKARTRDLEQSHKRTKSILQALQSGIVVVDIETHKIIEVNPAAEKMIGTSSENILGQICHKYICPADIGNCPVTDHRQRVDKSERIILTDKEQEIPVFKTIVPITLDGRKCLLESFVDISEQKQAQLMLQNNAKRQSLLAQFAQKALSEIALDELLNAASKLIHSILEKSFVEIMLYNPERRVLLFKSGLNWDCGENHNRLINDNQNMLPGYCLRHTEPVTCENIQDESRFTFHELPSRHNIQSAMITAIPGQLCPVGTMAVYYQHPFHFEQDQISFFKMVSNILSAAIDRRTMREQLEQRIESRTADVQRLLKQKDGFVNRLGHDLKTPLTPLVSLLPLIHNNSEDEQTRKILKLSIESVNYMKNLVDKTLQLASLNNLEEAFKPSNMDISKLLNETINAFGYMINDAHISIVNKLDSPIHVFADETEIREVLFNLITNAVKYSKHSGTITIGANTDKNNTIISIKDTGIGMTAEQAARAFEEYYKADDSRHDRSSIGLGLGICKRIIELHNGNIWAHSDGIGKGSTIYFTLPTSQDNNDDFTDKIMQTQPTVKQTGDDNE